MQIEVIEVMHAGNPSLLSHERLRAKKSIIPTRHPAVLAAPQQQRAGAAPAAKAAAEQRAALTGDGRWGGCADGIGSPHEDALPAVGLPGRDADGLAHLQGPALGAPLRLTHSRIFLLCRER